MKYLLKYQTPSNPIWKAIPEGIPTIKGECGYQGLYNGVPLVYELDPTLIGKQNIYNPWESGEMQSRQRRSYLVEDANGKRTLGSWLFVSRYPNAKRIWLLENTSSEYKEPEKEIIVLQLDSLPRSQSKLDLISKVPQKEEPDWRTFEVYSPEGKLMIKRIFDIKSGKNKYMASTLDGIFGKASDFGIPGLLTLEDILYPYENNPQYLRLPIKDFTTASGKYYLLYKFNGGKLNYLNFFK